MSLTSPDVERMAYLARLRLEADHLDRLVADLSAILRFVEQMNRADTEAVAPLAHPLEIAARLRKDEVTETDKRTSLQSCAPLVEAGLYLVPKVIE